MNITELRFIVVDDDDLDGRLLLRLLDSLGSHSNLEAAGGESALKLFLIPTPRST